MYDRRGGICKVLGFTRLRPSVGVEDRCTIYISCLAIGRHANQEISATSGRDPRAQLPSVCYCATPGNAYVVFTSSNTRSYFGYGVFIGNIGTSTSGASDPPICFLWPNTITEWDVAPPILIGHACSLNILSKKRDLLAPKLGYRLLRICMDSFFCNDHPH